MSRRWIPPTLAAVTALATVATPASAAPETDAMSSWANAALRHLTLEQRVGQLFVATVWGKSADEAHPENKKRYGVDTPAQVVQRYHVGGVIYFNNAGTDNVDDPAQLTRFSNGLQRAALTSGAHIPLLISIDQEGGNVTRVVSPASEYPSAMAVGAGRKPEDAKRLAAISGHELRAMGINHNFAPDADVNSNPLNPVIAARSFSSDPTLAGEMVSAQIAGYQRAGWPGDTVSAAAKHFPGHGDAKDDSHYGLPQIDRTEDQWRKIDLPPFKAAIAAGVDSIMTAHITVPSIDPSKEPATLSKKFMTDILRNELKYDGVIVTDSLAMDGVRKMHPDTEIPVLALEAGVDQMLMPPSLDTTIGAVIDAVRSGRISEDRINQSVLRILKQKWKRGVFLKPFADERALPREVGTKQNLAEVQRISDRTVTVLRNDAKLLPVKTLPGKVLVTGWNNPAFPGKPAEPVAALAKELGATALATGAAPTTAQIDQAVAVANGSDLVIVLTNGLRTSASQRALVSRLKETGKPVIAVASQVPYDPAFVDVPTWITTYAWRDVSMASLAKVITGKVAPKGKLPVNVPNADSSGVLFPFGTGLTW
ncbi:glycoside hydrolase family 3 protein [Kibdelosporangium phytohabitans]|uniref:glycoside hydrolase family 3 protein n=1 Tax=Kibdelosporangium phytohabitans TaxID=860235 RepID=UPI000A8CF1C6|nr:glycoside hydrolase family 3 protein [Kibdelosporangium phytohabitans]MBE1466154.1 beta-N-acetylhexosaminidase [Kibdelosporangium phytohabitans]